MHAVTFLAAVFFTLSAPALPALSYLCEGSNLVDGSEVTFKMAFQDSDEFGTYFDQNLTITHVDGKELTPAVVFQMFGAYPENNCVKTPYDEYLLGEGLTLPNPLELQFSLTLESSCVPELPLKLVGNCELQ